MATVQRTQNNDNLVSADDDNRQRAQKRLEQIRAEHKQARQRALKKAAKEIKAEEQAPRLAKKDPFEIFLNLFFTHFSRG